MLEPHDPEKERRDKIIGVIAFVVVLVLIALVLIGKLPVANFYVP